VIKRVIDFLFLCLPLFGAAQQNITDSLKHLLLKADNDSARYDIYGKLSRFYIETEIDSALIFIEECLSIAKKNNKKLNEAANLNVKAVVLRHLGRYPESLQCYQEAFEIARDPESEKNFWALPLVFSTNKSPEDSRLIVIGNLHMGMANLFIRVGNTELAIYHFAEARRIGEETNAFTFLYYLYATMGIAYKNLNMLDSAMIIEQEALSLSKQFGYKENVSRILAYIGEINLARGNINAARKLYHDGLQHAYAEKNFVSLVIIYFGLAKSFIAENEKDSSLYYAKKAKEELNKVGSLAGTVWNLATANENLYMVYKLRNEPDSAYKYIRLAMLAKDSLNDYRVKSSAQFQDLFLQEQVRLKEMEKDRIQFRNRVRTYSMLAGIGIMFFLSIIFYKNYRQKQKAKVRVEKAYDELKSTQAQLIQQEKMASLGELTAGIAHEIQNPLNFVNNFSEVSNELVDEMNSEIEKGEIGEAKAIANDIKQNLEKINHHGKRADAIVKGMLQHSRSSGGKKEPTAINALADEYLRLAYHGLRAKDKSFSAKTETHFDATIGKINVIPQDIGRVILNLINNAFYAVDEKRKSGIENYEPIVTVSTKTVKPAPGGGSLGVEIKVADNGNGIPQKVLDKIFQPFFTTKPTGQGTGLGLSLSYDIVKAHGGELKVETKEGEFAEFNLILPV
jgi:two-component system, NtrC family, sensor kinase